MSDEPKSTAAATYSYGHNYIGHNYIGHNYNERRTEAHGGSHI